MWGYYWGFSAAQIELLAIDSPIVVYDYKGKKKKRKTESAKVNPSDVRAKAEEWERKYGNGNERVTFDFSQYS